MGKKKNAGRNKLTVGLGALLGWNWVLETHSPYGPELSVPVSAEESIEARPALCDRKTLPFIPHKFIKYFHTPSTKVGRDHAFIKLRGIKLSSWSHGTSPCTSKKKMHFISHEARSTPNINSSLTKMGLLLLSYSLSWSCYFTWQSATEG